jgi:hypothetical protein
VDHVAPTLARALERNMMPGMTSNVISLASLSRGRQIEADAQSRARAALVSELIELMDHIRHATDHTIALSGPPLQVQRTAQHLLDAMTALECAADILTEEGKWTPF